VSEFQVVGEVGEQPGTLKCACASPKLLKHERLSVEEEMRLDVALSEARGTSLGLGTDEGALRALRD
jgi:hypothetical protein